MSHAYLKFFFFFIQFDKIILNFQTNLWSPPTQARAPCQCYPACNADQIDDDREDRICEIALFAPDRSASRDVEKEIFSTLLSDFSYHKELDEGYVEVIGALVVKVKEFRIWYWSHGFGNRIIGWKKISSEDFQLLKEKIWTRNLALSTEWNCLSCKYAVLIHVHIKNESLNRKAKNQCS